MSAVIEKIQESLKLAFQELGLPMEITIHLERPASDQFGDYSTNVALITFSQIKNQGIHGESFKNPRELADKILEILTRFQGDQDFFSKIEVAGPGFINFTLSTRFLIQESLSQKPMFVAPQRSAVVEFSSPNIAKPFTIGHLRSTIIGHAVANLLEATGWKIYRDNHLGDWGTQFGKQIYAIKNLGDENKIDQSAEPVKDLVELYVKFHQEAEQKPELEDEARAWFKKLEEGDPEARRLWQKCIDWSLKEFARIYQRLGVQFTENDGKGYGESFFEEKMGSVIEELRQKKLLTESEGAELVFFPNEKLPPLMILKKDGASLYATRDLATDKFRLSHYGSDIKVINEVGAEQAEYFNQLYELEEMLGWYQPNQRVHVKHGFYRFKDKKMSTRKGNVIWLEEVLDEAVKRAKQVATPSLEAAEAVNRVPTRHTEETEQNAEKIGLGALKWNDLKRSSHLDITFDWDEILSMDGNSGPYMQYTYARGASVLKKAAEKGVSDFSRENLAEYAPNTEEISVLRTLFRNQEALERAAAEFAPHHLSTYLFDLAQHFNSFYNKHHILVGKEEPGSPEQKKTELFRLALTAAVAKTIQAGLEILGIETVENM